MSSPDFGGGQQRPINPLLPPKSRLIKSPSKDKLDRKELKARMEFMYKVGPDIVLSLSGNNPINPMLIGSFDEALKKKFEEVDQRIRAGADTVKKLREKTDELNKRLVVEFPTKVRHVTEDLKQIVVMMSETIGSVKALEKTRFEFEDVTKRAEMESSLLSQNLRPNMTVPNDAHDFFLGKIREMVAKARVFSVELMATVSEMGTKNRPSQDSNQLWGEMMEAMADMLSVIKLLTQRVAILRSHTQRMTNRVQPAPRPAEAPTHSGGGQTSTLDEIDKLLGKMRAKF